MEVSESALEQFNKVLDEARERHQAQHREFRIMPLLEILNIVARARRLGMVFRGNPKYRDRANVVFGKEQLQNSDLMEDFASCLPGYIDSISKDKGREFMEGMVREDDLWSSLQVNLWNAMESGVSDKLRTFEACCTVIDVMFTALEDSDMDWRAPEFGSLSEHFELFATTCFQGAFVGGSIGFRVGLIKLRFCDALLGQFGEEVAQERAISLRSQWDVASLARVFYTLEVGDEDDVAFWKSLTSGGRIEADFIRKAREMLDAAIRDGPLLNFCKLGLLTVTAVPFSESGLKDADIENVRKLQRRILPVTNEHPPEHPPPPIPATDRSQRKLNRLEHEVCEAIQSSGEEKGMLQELLTMIGKVKDLCPLSAQQLDDDTSSSTHNPTSSRVEIRHLISGDIVNQVDVKPFAKPPVPHPSASTKHRFHRFRPSTPALANLPVG
jgi:hypothetical protein